jgi:hypothetical protein
MKSQTTPFEELGEEEPTDLQDIVKILAKLDKSNPTGDCQLELSNRSHPAKRRDF